MADIARPFTNTSVFVRRNRCAVLTIDHPPVNGISLEVRTGLHEGLRSAIADPDIEAIVITGAAKQFSAGADIRQFNTPASNQWPLTRDLHALIAQSSKPVVAAIHGYALGGAFELALGCHFRVATPCARLGLPEVKLGLIPGGGGTQRLPRLIGVEAALNMIQSGDAIDGTAALEFGLVDAIAQDDVVAAAIKHALSQAGTGAALPLVARMPVRAECFDFAARRDAVRPEVSNLKAQQAAITAVEFGMHLPFDLAVTNERAIFDKLVVGPESAALRHAFFARKG